MLPILISTYFDSFGCILQSPSMKKGQTFDVVRGGRYVLQQASSEVKESTISMTVIQKKQSTSHVFNFLSKSTIISINSVSNVSLWHSRLGNFPLSLMRNFNFINVSSNPDFFCDVYPQARKTRLFFQLVALNQKAFLN